MGKKWLNVIQYTFMWFKMVEDGLVGVIQGLNQNSNEDNIYKGYHGKKTKNEN